VQIGLGSEKHFALPLAPLFSLQFSVFGFLYFWLLSAAFHIYVGARKKDSFRPDFSFTFSTDAKPSLTCCSSAFDSCLVCSSADYFTD